MNMSVKKTRVNLDGLHSLDISVNEKNKTVIAELVVPDETPTMIYAEKFDAPCNYLKAAIKKGVVYLDGNKKTKPTRNDYSETTKGELQ